MISRLAFVILLLGLWPGAALASSPAASASGSAGAEAKGPELPLPELPELAPIEKLTATPDAVKDLEGRLAQIFDMQLDDPLSEPDLRMLSAELDDALVAAASQRLVELKGRIDGDAAERLLERARKAGRDAIKKWKKANKKSKEPEPAGDWLVFLLSLDKRGDTWRDAVELYSLLRLLEHRASTPAVRVMIESYAAFGELVRIDLQRALERLKDKAVPALLEATQHDARKVSGWARRQLDTLGKVTPGEIVSTTDHAILADTLRALGRGRDVEATRVVLSFTNSDRIELRQAAREAIAAIGEPAEWHLKDAYKSLTGNTPPRGWDFKRTAREIFRLHDQARLAKVYDLWDEGQKALEEKRFADAVAAFDRVLARVPLFDERAKMVPAYLGRAEALAEEGKRDEAMVALRKALRLTPGTDSPKVEAQLMALEAEALHEKGTPDRFLVERALELDPDNARAKELLGQLEQEAEERESHTKRYVAAAGIGIVGLALAILVLRRPRRRSDPKASPEQVKHEGDGEEPHQHQADGAEHEGEERA